MKNFQALIIGILTILLIGNATANAANWIVTKSTNSSDGACDADCSLREAVAAADSGDTVVFNSGLVGQTFTLGGAEIVITKRIIIDGFINNPNVVFLSGNNTSRIFLIEDGAGLDLKNMILVQGNAASSNFDNGRGSAIYAKQNSSLSLDRVAVRGNTANVAAVIVRTGTHHITNSSFTTNSANTCMAIYNQDSGANLYIANVTFSGNFDPVQDNFGSGAICNSGNLTIRNSTIANNFAEVGGGGIFSVGGSINLGNTIVAQNSAANAPDIQIFNNTITSVGGNLIGSTQGTPAGTFTQPNDITGVNPLLVPINVNLGGHPVVYHPLQAGSPARNGGLNANAVDPLTNSPLTTDTRGAGFPRITDTTVDIGAFEDQSGNTSLIVTKNANSNDLVCDIDCSLREAVHQASLNFGTETITFAPNVFGTVPLGGSEILIQNQNVNIVGYPNSNANVLNVSGENTNRIFRLNNAAVNISGMTLSGGNGTGGSGNFGGAILAENGSSLTLDRMIISNNFAVAYGAVYLSGGTHRFINSTISTNSANTGLALGISGTLNMANTTISGNFDADGGTGFGAIYLTGTANIRNSTIAFNRTAGGTGGGIVCDGALNIGNSIVSDNIAAVSPDIHRSSGTIISTGGNLISNASGFPAGTFNQTNDAIGVTPSLGALADNGGVVTTHSLMPNSPAQNTGINGNAVDPFNNSVLLTDGRGSNYLRIVGGTVDKGAFEATAPTAATVSVSGRVTVGKGTGLTNAVVTLTDLQGNSRTARSSAFGYYSFETVEVGQTYIIGVSSKRYQFAQQVLFVTEDVGDLDFTASP